MHTLSVQIAAIGNTLKTATAICSTLLEQDRQSYKFEQYMLLKHLEIEAEHSGLIWSFT